MLHYLLRQSQQLPQAHLAMLKILLDDIQK